MTKRRIYNDELWEKIFFRLAKGEKAVEIAARLGISNVYLREKLREFKKMSEGEFKTHYDRITQW